MARKNFSCDFETTTDPNDCRVWAYGWMDIDNVNNWDVGTSIDDFMAWAEKVKGNLFFHNLKFDGAFIVNWLLRNGWKWNDSGDAGTFTTSINKMGSWYIIDICYGYSGKRKLHTIIYDSMKKLPFPVSKIAKDFQLPMAKGEIDYHKPRPVGYVPDAEEIEYIRLDIEIVARALKIQFDQGLEKITNGSDSLHDFKSIISKKQFEKYFPVLSLPLNEKIRKAYRGGFTWLNDRFKEKEIGEGIVFDVNSLYPAVMYNKPIPVGVPIWFEGKYEYDEQYPLYIQTIICEFELKENKIPTIQIKKNLMFMQNEYLHSSKGERVELHLTNVDLELIKEHYHLYDVEYVDGMKFKEKSGLFNAFIDKWTLVKTTEEGAKKALAKLMLNSLYGKFATNPDVTGKYPYLKPDGRTGFADTDPEFRDPIYTPAGAFITAWARHLTITTAQKCYDRIIYCDTDSIHLTGTETPEAIKDIVDDKKLGYWGNDGQFSRAKYLRQKTYIQQIGDKMKVVCSGMPDEVKKKVTFENFKPGFSAPGKLTPKQVPGGVVLMDTVFTIKKMKGDIQNDEI